MTKNAGLPTNKNIYKILHIFSMTTYYPRSFDELQHFLQNHWQADVQVFSYGECIGQIVSDVCVLANGVITILLKQEIHTFLESRLRAYKFQYIST